MSKRKIDAKGFAQQKRMRRRWLTFFRMCRYGINNFSRNAWLSLAATAIMTVTLLVIFISSAAGNVLTNTANEVRDKVDMSIYLKTDTSDSDAQAIKAQLLKLSSVKRVDYVSPAQGREKFAQDNKTSNQVLGALDMATNMIPGTLNIGIVDINNTTQLANFVNTNKLLKQHIDSNYPPTFAGDKKVVIQNIGRVVSFAEKLGIGASILFVAISSLIVFNTIRMAIFNRKEEIQMMKLIGAEQSFIRGPFIVEAMVYGFIAALFATVAGGAVLYASRQKLLDYQIAIQPTINFVTTYAAFVLLGMIVLGAVIGVISSLLATRRYLKL